MRSIRAFQGFHDADVQNTAFPRLPGRNRDASPSLAFAKPECTKLYYSVNDYGKEGPSRDAEALLDKYIQKWAQEKGVKNYKAGKKDVTCELFLDAIVFNEYTCQAKADVCWSRIRGAAFACARVAPPAHAGRSRHRAALPITVIKGIVKARKIDIRPFF